MTSQIEDLNCQVCSTYQQNNAKEPMLTHTIPECPWAQVDAYIFLFNGKNLADYYSAGFIKLNLLHTTTS